MGQDDKKECALPIHSPHLWANSAPEAVTKAVLAQPPRSVWPRLLQQACLYHQWPEQVAPMVLAAMVLSIPHSNMFTQPNMNESNPTRGRRFLCLSLATGTRCSGLALMEKYRSVRRFLISDGHAEVLARRSFLSFLFDAIDSSSSSGCSAEAVNCHPFVMWDVEKKGWQLHPSVEIHFVCTHWPCGSMALAATSRTGGHLLLRTPCARLFGTCERDRIDEVGCKRIPLRRDTVSSTTYVFGHLLAAHESVWEKDPRYAHCCRVKPGKGHPNLNMSCSDKLWRWSSFGLQGKRCMGILTRPIPLTSIEIAIEMSTTSRNTTHGKRHVSTGEEQARNALESLRWKTRAFEEQMRTDGSGSAFDQCLLPLPSISVFSIEQFYLPGNDVLACTKSASFPATTISDSGYSRCTWLTNIHRCKEATNKCENRLSPTGIRLASNYHGYAHGKACEGRAKRARSFDFVEEPKGEECVTPGHSQCIIEATWKESYLLTLNTKVGLPQGFNLTQLQHALENKRVNLFTRYPLSQAWLEARTEIAKKTQTEDMMQSGFGLCALSLSRGGGFPELLYDNPSNARLPEKKMLWVVKQYDLRSESENVGG